MCKSACQGTFRTPLCLEQLKEHEDNDALDRGDSWWIMQKDVIDEKLQSVFEYQMKDFASNIRTAICLLIWFHLLTSAVFVYLIGHFHRFR